MRIGTVFRVCMAAAAFVSGAAQAQNAARIETLNGVAWVVRSDGRATALAQDSEINIGDTVRTERDSTARLRFGDGTTVALRPATSFRIDSFRYAENAPQEDSFAAQLLKGGFRQITGLISKRNRESITLRAATSTIGIRGTDFSVRMCEEDCATEGGSPVAQAMTAEPVARVVVLKGRATARQGNAAPRPIAPGAPLYEGDLLATGEGSYAGLFFRDDTRIMLESGSLFDIATYRFENNGPGKGAARLRLLRGYAHVSTGALAKLRANTFAFEGAMGTIRPRGTGFSFGGCIGSACGNVTVDLDSGGTADAGRIEQDLVVMAMYGAAAIACAAGGGSPCIAESGSEIAADTIGRASVIVQDASPRDTTRGAAAPIPGVYVWDGVIEVVSGSGRTTVGRGEALVRRDAGALRLIPASAPRPELVSASASEVFGETGSIKKDAGVYVFVHDGEVLLRQADQEIVLAKGEVGFADAKNDPPQRIDTPPPFMRRDPLLGVSSIGGQMCRP